MATRKTTTTRTAQLKAPTRVTRSTTSRTPTPSEPPAPKKTVVAEKSRVVRKPLVNRDNAPLPPSKTKKPKPQEIAVENDDREPIKAFLRIRPIHDESTKSSVPYLKSLSETTVQMTDLSGTNRIRMHPQAQLYTFTHVFPPETQQADFFTKTALPLVQTLLQGQNGLIFTYGVTNSGKTYTIQGGTQPKTAGLLPRTLDVIFNSLDGLHSSAKYRPVRLAGIEPDTDDNPLYTLSDISDEGAIAAALGEVSSQECDTTAVSVDKNYGYSLWISYAEVYNEKVYDLLSNDSPDEGPSSCGTPTGTGGSLARPTNSKKLPRNTSTIWSNLASLTRKDSTDVLLVKRKALSLKNDPDSGGKYVAGLKCIRVNSAEEAKRVFRTGNINRRVFGTLANAVSSRSHGIFTLRAVRIHKADPSDITVSRLSIVDLAGSERTKNTQNTGERLKEAGSINKSLMVLGQCMEAMRTNQRRLAATLANPGRGIMDPNNPRGLKLAIIPFRHSKLTEVFQDFFVGEQEGRAVMIVNVNPYDTGFDENSHVMRFAALAREVTTAPSASLPKATVRQPAAPIQRSMPASTPMPQRRKVTVSTGGSGNRKPSEAHIEVVEEDEEHDEEDNDDEPTDLLVDALFEELEDLRIRLYESEMRCAVIEAETREEVLQEVEARMMDMERVFAKRLKNAVEQNEAKTDAKIDMLHQFGAFANKSRTKRTAVEDESFDSVQSGYTEQTDTTESVDVDEDALENSYGHDSSFENTFNQSPLRHKGLSKTEKRKFSSGPAVIGLREEDMTIDEVDAEETRTIGGDSEEETEEDEGTEEVSEDEDEEHDDDEEEWSPPPKSSKGRSTAKKAVASPPTKAKSGSKPKSSGVTEIQKKMDVLSLFADELDDTDKSLSTSHVDDDDDTEEHIPKPKRQSTRDTRSSTGVRRSTRHTKLN